jgi:hypothetical protein
MTFFFKKKVLIDLTLCTIVILVWCKPGMRLYLQQCMCQCEPLQLRTRFITLQHIRSVDGRVGVTSKGGGGGVGPPGFKPGPCRVTG